MAIGKRHWRTGAILALGGLGLAACATAPSRVSLSTATPSSRPAPPPAYGSGGGSGLHGTEKPYQINGVWYDYPHSDPNYDVVGYASWYGQAFHNKHTADGEIFDQFGLSAAHKTLPLPSLVEVTNLDNGRSITLRLNDRGPFVGDRVLDVSRAAAERLGFDRKGLTRVRVRYAGPAPALPIAVTYAAADAPPRHVAPQPAPRYADADADAAMPTVSSRPSGQVQAQPLSAPNAYAPIALAANDTSRYTEPSVAYGPGAMAPAATPTPMTSAPIEAASPPPTTSLPPPPRPVEMAALDAPPVALPPPSADPAPASSSSLGAPSGFSVQAGAFSSRDNAERAAAQLGSAAAVRPMARGGMTLYRVVLAGYADVGAAQAARAQAVAAGFADARVVSAY